jgi:hypothetical protein
MLYSLAAKSVWNIPSPSKQIFTKFILITKKILHTHKNGFLRRFYTPYSIMLIAATVSVEVSVGFVPVAN